VDTRNLTLNLPSDLIQRAKIYAAEHGTTINTVVRKILEETVSRENRSRTAADRLLALAERLSTTEDPGCVRREELYDRR
jgi:plasmid stability protein